MADPKSIHEFLPTSGNIGSLFLVDDPDSQATSGYTTRNISMDDVGEMVNNGIDYTQDLSTENKKIIGALNELHGVDGYDVYDNTATYAVGDICIHSNSLQVCTTAVTVAEDFDSNKWSPTTIKALLASKANKSDVDNSTVTITRHSSAPSSTPLANIMRRGHVVIIEFVHKFAAGTYYQLFNVTPLPMAQVHATVWIGGQQNLVSVLGNGVVQFNNSTTIAADNWVIGEIVYITAN